MLFKASEHKFSLPKYYELCGAETNTILICLNDKNKIIGAFTPLHLAIKTLHDMGLGCDNSCESFVFSLTTNEKFSLRKYQPAITRFDNINCVCFGNGFFIIGNNANSPTNIYTSSLYFNNFNYDCLHYRDNKGSYLKVLGN